MPSLFLHRISVVRVYLSIAATTQDPAGRDPHQCGTKQDNHPPLWVMGNLDQATFRLGQDEYCLDKHICLNPNPNPK